MKKQAFILFFPLLVFLAETASFLPCWDSVCVPADVKTTACTQAKKPGRCTAEKETGSCGRTKKESMCTAKEAKSLCSKTGKQDTYLTKKGCEKRSPGKDCGDDPDCSTCPVCYTFICQSQYEWAAQVFVLKKNYSSLNTSFHSAYTTNVWKPPNGVTGPVSLAG